MRDKLHIYICVFVCLIVTVAGIVKDISFTDLGMLLILSIVIFYPLGLYIKKNFFPGRRKDIDEHSDGV